VHRYRNIKGKGVIFFKTAHIQCKQCVAKKLGIEGEFSNAQVMI
jgi:hypothetical protein